MTEYTREHPIHNIPNYPTLYIRDGAFVFMVDKTTGEISNKLSLRQYVEHWRKELETNEHVFKYYMGNYFHPKPSPDTATNIKELHRLCSDRSREKRGTDGFLLDFLWAEKISLTETKLFKYLCDNAIVWNYSALDECQLQEILNLSTKRQARVVYAKLQDKGLVKIVYPDFEIDGEYRHLVKLHPMLFWKGRKSAWKVAIGESYEYGENITLE